MSTRNFMLRKVSTDFAVVYDDFITGYENFGSQEQYYELQLNGECRQGCLSSNKTEIRSKG